ncbi:methyl-accepting chemotaxis protein [Niallia sp. 01092]|uniref:methyl-accepting chemotaxis protein n=1 Tax=unclassified Niallia TaxID=2837522 RepID=UPI003FD0CBBE
MEKSKKKKFTFNLSTKLYITFALILLIPTITVGLLSYDSAKKELGDNLLKTAEENVNLLNSNINTTISPKIHDIQYFAEQITAESLKDGKSSSQVVTSFKQYINLHPEIQSIYIGTPKGETIMYPISDMPDGYDPRQRPWYQDAMQKKGEVVVTSPYVDAGTEEMVVTITKVLNDGAGVIAVDINIKNLKKTAEEVNIGKSGYAVLLDSQQNYIVSPSEKAGTKAKEDFFQKLYAEKSGELYYDYKGSEKIMYFSTNEQTGWKIAGTLLISEIADDSKPILKTTLIVIAVAIIISACIIMWIVHSIVSRLKALQQKAQTVSKGDLTETIEIKRHDEIGNLAQAFQEMQESLRHTLQTIEDHALQVSSSAEELNASSSQTSEATEQVAAAIQDVASSAEKQTMEIDKNNASIEKISKGSSYISDSTLEVAELTKDTTKMAEEGEKAVLETVDQMSLIHNSVIESNDMIRSLSDRSKEIGSILGVITSISEQTNLLALNAAIEAARAGEAGKGFAIVADEVRKLAEQSQLSAKKIAELIQAIQKDTENTVQKMSTVVDNVKDGLIVSEDAIKKFTEILSSMQEITPKIETVSSTIQQMAGGIQEVEATSFTISDIAKNNAAASEEVAASTEEQLATMEEISSSASTLSSMAEELNDLLAKFRFK